MLTATPSTSRGWMTLLAGLAIALTGSLIACGARTADLGDGGTSSGGGGGGFPYSGPSCSATTITPACWSCLQGACPAFVGCVEFVNADEIAHGLSAFRPEAVALAAGRARCPLKP